MAEAHSAFLRALMLANLHNVQRWGSDYPSAAYERLTAANQNARCFLAIEVEKGNIAAKYLIGSALNAVALGRIGLVVCWSDVRLGDLLRIREYLAFLASVEKNTFSVDNLLIVSSTQLDDAVAAQVRPGRLRPPAV